MTHHDLDAANRWRAYTQGFRDGAGSRGGRDRASGWPSALADVYHEGYTAGQRALGVAVDAAPERFGFRPSVLRGGE